MVYFATFNYELDGGIMVTASHNPREYNGMKLVGPGARPISSDNGLLEIRERVRGHFAAPAQRGTRHQLSMQDDYINHLLGYVDAGTLATLRIVVNAGNGGAGAVIDELEKFVPFQFIKLLHEPDGTFPQGVPNPLLPENRTATSARVIANNADFGLAWDGDFDRCFFFDERGRFIEGYYIVGLLAQQFLQKEPQARIIHDPRLTWNTLDIVSALGGQPVQSKTGHAFIKQRMRDEDAVYGGEMSAHHYFRDFAYCDSGMIPWLMVAEIISRTRTSLSQLIDERINRFPASGEINRTLANPQQALSLVETTYGTHARSIEYVDGLSMAFDDWRFNLRLSNTEPLVRLNVETRGNAALMETRTRELLALLDHSGAVLPMP
jgi:phosphomannomutase